MDAALERFSRPQNQFQLWRDKYNQVLEEARPSPKLFGKPPYWFVVEQAPPIQLFQSAAHSPKQGYTYMPLAPGLLGLRLPKNHRKREITFPDVGQLLELVLDGTGYQMQIEILGIQRPQRTHPVTCIVEVKFL